MTTLERAGIGQADDTRRGDWVRTASGRRFWPLDPRAAEIEITDIAHALALQCRFAGHCAEFYSVAQHCVIVSRICEPEEALWGLLHDASEAYLCDVPRPLKRDPAMRFYQRAEWQVQTAVLIRFGLSNCRLPVETFWTPESVKHADDVALRTECRDLMEDPQDWTWPEGIKPLAATIRPECWQVAEMSFLRRFDELTKQG